MNNEILTKVKNHCKDLLSKSKCKSLQFHNYQHTLNVVQNAEIIAIKSELSEEDKEMVIISAYFHDVGNMEKSRQHEMLSCSIARKFLENENYPKDKINIIENIILATEINREPTNLLEEIICDADLSHLGKKTFLVQNLQLREEWSNFLGLVFTDEEWLNLNLKFLNEHHFYTDVARNLYSKQKSLNLLKFQNSIS